MRKLTVFIASFVVVLVAGAAVAQMGSFPRASDAAGETSTGVVGEPAYQPDAVEEPAAEPETDTADEPAHQPETDTADEPADDLWIEVLYPHPEQAFDDKTLVFEGKATPGSRVFAGKYEADINDDGVWRIVLILSPGWNHVTFTAVSDDGREATDWVKVFYEAPAPKEEPPKDDKPPVDEPADWEFVAHQAYGECSDNPPYDVFYGKGKPGTRITVTSEFGDGVTEVNDNGEWELKVTFPEAPFNDTFLVKVTDEFGHVATFEFTRVGGDQET